MKLILSVLLVAPLISLNAWSLGGSTSVGDGGHVIICKPAPGGTQLELLEVLEGRVRYGVQNDLTPENLAERLSETGMTDERVQFFIHDMNRLRREIQFDKNIPFGNPGGFFEGSEYGQCQIRQLANHYVTTEGVQLKADRQLYKKLSAHDRFLFFVHERIHRYHMGGSPVTRQLVIYLGANQAFRDRNRDAFRTMITTGNPIEMK